MLKNIFLFFFLASQVFSIGSKLEVSTDKEYYYRYDIVRFNARIKPRTILRKKLNAIAFFYYKSSLVKTITGDTKVDMLYNRKNGIWYASFPVPWGVKKGSYKIEVLLYDKNYNIVIEGIKKFGILEREVKKMIPGFCALTIEQLPENYQRYRGPFNKKRSYYNAIRWAEFIGADAIWCLIGQSQLWGRKKDEFPWSHKSIKLLKKLAKSAKKKGLKIGAWICLGHIWGKCYYKASYKFATGYKKERLKRTKFISIGDRKREKDIIKLVKILNEDKNIDFIGFDYVRTHEFGGYELVDDFVKTMGIKVSRMWIKQNKRKKMIWLARNVSGKNKNRNIYLKWGWYRARKMALWLKDILNKAKPDKQIWAFTLGWQHGMQHGQDPLMYKDAGIDINSIMLYHADNEKFNEMMKSWRRYTRDNNSNYVLGEIVDAKEYESDKDVSTASAVNRHIKAVNAFTDKSNNIGLFWHDLFRILYGRRGDFSSLEWAIAGGTSFYKFRLLNNNIKFAIKLSIPSELALNNEGKIIVVVKNLGNSDSRFKVKAIELPGFKITGRKEKTVMIKKKQSMAVSFKIYPTTLKYIMVNCMVIKQSNNKKGFDFKYIKVNEKSGNN